MKLISIEMTHGANRASKSILFSVHWESQSCCGRCCCMLFKHTTDSFNVSGAQLIFQCLTLHATLTSMLMLMYCVLWATNSKITLLRGDMRRYSIQISKSKNVVKAEMMKIQSDLQKTSQHLTYHPAASCVWLFPPAQVAGAVSSHDPAPGDPSLCRSWPVCQPLKCQSNMKQRKHSLPNLQTCCIC